MDDNNIKAILLKIYEEQKNTNNKVEKVERQLDEMKNQISEMENQISETQNQTSKMQELVNEIPSIKRELRMLSGRVAVIEKEHGEKLQILLDVVTGNTEKSKILEKRIENNKKILNRHTDEIFYLKKKVQNS